MERLPRRVVTALTVTVLLAAIVAGGLLVVLPRVTGGAALTVLSGSMTPTYPVGSTVFVRPVVPEDVREGDVITFANTDGRSFTTHRVMEIEVTDDGRQFITKGDANRGNDPQPIPESAIRGRVWFHVPLIGRLRDAVSTPLGLGLIGGLAGLSAIWDPATSFLRRRVRRPAWLSDRILRPSPVPSSTPAPSAPHEQLDLAPPVQAVPSSAADLAREEAELVDPIPVSAASVDLHPTTRVEQQLMLARLNAGAFARGKVIELLGLVRGHVVSVGSLHMVVSISGTPEHLDGVEELLRSYGLVEATRSAVVHVGGAPTPQTNVPRPPESVGTLDKNLKALVLRPPVPPSLTLAGASSNGHHHEGANQ